MVILPAPQLPECFSEGNNSYRFLVSAILGTTALVLWHLRRRYPCITIFEMDSMEHTLDHIYDRIPKVENLHMDHLTKLEDITRKLIHVKIKASRIRTRSLTSNTKWKIYLGLDPKIAPEVIAWNYGAKVLERDMLLLIEAVAQHRFETRLMGIGLQIVASQS